MGGIPHIYSPDELDSAHSGKKYTKFLIVLEIVYAILMGWGFARVAEYFLFDNLYNWAGLVIAGFVLIRFFFAPSHNVGALVRSAKINLWKARLIIFFDIPILMAHSFIYYRICYNLSIKAYGLFYFNLALLLFLNASWLSSIKSRLIKEGLASPPKFSLWINNNFISSMALLVVWATHKYIFTVDAAVYFWISFAIAASNCIVDLASCALEYFEET